MIKLEEKLSNENYNYTYHFGEALKGSINSKTKLEEKLIELGYKECLWEKGKWDNEKYNIVIFTNEEITKIEDYYAFSNQIRKQTTVDFIQASFNQMQKDLEELKKYEQ